MPGIIVVGAQWGDEGKGKVIDILTTQAQHVVRAQGGNNAGHTVIIGEEEYKLHLIPSGILHSHTQCYIAAGTVVDPEVLIQEMQGLSARGIILKGRLWISPAAHVIFPYHRILDHLIEESKGDRAIGTTGRGIGPCYADKAQRLGIRVGEFIDKEVFTRVLKSVLQVKNYELTHMYGAPPMDESEILEKYLKYAEILAPFVCDVEDSVNEALEKGAAVLFEGAQGTFLDITTGTYPFVTSANTVAGGLCVGAGVGPTRIDHTLGVIKAYTTRVGNGPLPTEVTEGDIFLDHHRAREYGTTTGRKRRIGWFDAVLARRAVRLNGMDSLAITKLDILDGLDQVKICTGYQIHGKRIETLPSLAEEFEKVLPIYETHPGWNEDTTEVTSWDELPENARKYLERIEVLCKTPISMVSVGPERDRTLILQQIFQPRNQRVSC